MSWLLKWEGVSDCTATRPDLNMRKTTDEQSASGMFTQRLMGFQDQVGLSYFSCWLCDLRSHRNGFLRTALCISDVSVGEFCLKVFNIISLMSVCECVFGKRTLLNDLKWCCCHDSHWGRRLFTCYCRCLLIVSEKVTNVDKFRVSTHRQYHNN